MYEVEYKVSTGEEVEAYLTGVGNISLVHRYIVLNVAVMQNLPTMATTVFAVELSEKKKCKKDIKIYKMRVFMSSMVRIFSPGEKCNVPKPLMEHPSMTDSSKMENWIKCLPNRNIMGRHFKVMLNCMMNSNILTK